MSLGSGLLCEQDTRITWLSGRSREEGAGGVAVAAGLVRGWVALTWLWIPQRGDLGAG